MKELILTNEFKNELEEIYAGLQHEYARVAGELAFSCTGCSDNCCDSYFSHYTYVDWAYLWEGIRQLKDEDRNIIPVRATDYQKVSRKAQQRGERPRAMCPLNVDGRCGLYQHRLLVCRTHGVPARMTRPDGKSLVFPGCFRCQDLVETMGSAADDCFVERTPFLQRLAKLEQDFLNHKRHLLPKVRLTIAEMILKGAPAIEVPHCEKNK